jgi:hypothetical protein
MAPPSLAGLRLKALNSSAQFGVLPLQGLQQLPDGL